MPSGGRPVERMKRGMATMKILFACGGTAGHINPAIAVANSFKLRHPEAEIRFVGNPHGMEAKLVPQAGFPFIPVVIQGFERRICWKNIKFNCSSVYYLLKTGKKLKKIYEEYQPDVVVGTGGYVSGPVLRKAAQLGIKTATHEQNAFPGVTTKLLCKYVDKVLLAVPEAQERLPHGREYIVTGNPVREEVIYADRTKARQELGVGDRLCLLSFGGSLGARRLNESIADVMAWHHRTGSIYHIHGTGNAGRQEFQRMLQERGVEFKGCPNLDIRPYIDNMATCLAAADLVICRAGAITLSELQAMGRASILIPSPNVAENHQYFNAMVLQEHGAAIVVEEKDLTGEKLCRLVEQLQQDPQRLRTLGINAQKMAILDANERICREILSLVRGQEP